MSEAAGDIMDVVLRSEAEWFFGRVIHRYGADQVKQTEFKNAIKAGTLTPREQLNI